MNPALVPVLNDSLNGNDKPFRSTFPYLAVPHSGQYHQHTNLFWTRLMLIFNNAGAMANLRTR
jgi:hypothetical protein